MVNIEWQTGSPPRNGGQFLVTYKGTVVVMERKKDFWFYYGRIISDHEITAFCRVLDIKPFKNETNIS